MSGAAKVTVNELDKTQRVSSTSTAIVAGVIPAVKGPVIPTFITNANALYRVYTPEQKFKSGYDLSYIEVENFLKGASSLYLNRAVSDSTFAGAVIYGSSSAKTNASVGQTFSDPTEFNFTTNNGRPLVGVSGIIVNSVNSKIQVSANFYELSQTGDSIVFTKEGAGVLPVEIDTGTTFYLIKDATSPYIKVASSKVNALAGTSISLSTGATATEIFVENTEVEFLTDEEQPLVLLYSANVGDWGNLVSVRTTRYETNNILVRDEGCFLLEVFYKGVHTGESFVVSFDKSKKSKFGLSTYIEEALTASNYVRARVNPIATSSSVIKENLTTLLTLDKGTSDDQILESVLIEALQPFRNVKKYKIKFLCDFGITLPAFQKEIIDICEKRGDCAFLLSTPLSVQVSADYVNAIVAYKSATLNSISNYGAIYTGHCKVLDSELGREIWISPSSELAKAAVAVWDSGLVYTPIANNRAMLNVLDVYRHFDDPEISILVNNGINPVRFEEGEGIKVWGERTLQIASTAFDRLHTRLLFNFIKPEIKKALEPFLFLLNDLDNPEGVWETMTDICNSFMNGIQADGGVYGFRVDISKNNNSKDDIVNSRVNVDVYLTPAYGIEEIVVNLTANNNFIEFNN